MKRLVCALLIGATLCSGAFLTACSGTAEIKYTLGEDGLHYVVSGVEGNKSALQTYEIPAVYSPSEEEAPLPVTEIGYEAFMECGRLYSVTMPDSITKIADRAFMGCPFSEIEISENCTSIGYGAFAMCSALKEITVPDSVTFLDERAFYGCSSLKTAKIFADVEDLVPYVFANKYNNYGGNLFTDTALEVIELSSNIKKIHFTAFDGNVKVSKIIFHGTEQQWDELYFYDYIKDEEGNISEKKLKKEDILLETPIEFVQ